MLDQAGHLLVSFAFEPQHWFMVRSLVGLSFLFQEKTLALPKGKNERELSF